jgi:hypothetical protein
VDEVLPLPVLDDLHLVWRLLATPLPYHHLGNFKISDHLRELGREGAALSPLPSLERGSNRTPPPVYTPPD